LEDEKAGEVLKFLLDTNILSEIRKPKPHGGVLAWFTANTLAGFATPSVALFELQMGAEKLREQDPLRAAAFDFWVGRIAGGSAVLPFDAAAARETARLLNKQSMTLMADAMIAAIAKVNGLTIATRNTRDFERFGVPLVNPFLFSRN
jgi:predicted nucleic acid-binding protein